MNLVVPEDDVRLMDGKIVEIFDEHSTSLDPVGEVKLEKGANRRIELFGGRYKATVKSHKECVAFVKGVEAVLEHMIG